VSGGEAPDRLHELARVERLGEICLGVHAIGLAAWIALTGEHDERHASQRHAQLACERRSVYAGHLHVEDDDGGRIFMENAHGLLAVRRFDHAEAVVFEDRVLRSTRRLVVVDDEHRTREVTDDHASAEADGVPAARRGGRLEPLGNDRRYTGVRVLVSFALFLAACGGTVGASPTPAPSPLPAAELKYRVMDAGGRIEFCDPDFYPIARANEEDLARAKIADVQKDADTYAAITKRVGTDALAVYRDWKALNALALTATGAKFSFNYRSTGGPSATATKATGTQVEGSVDVFGKVDIAKRTQVGPLNCPICLARDTRIATPSGDVAVQDLHVGDMVWTLVGGARIAAPLIAIGSTPVPATHEVVRLALDDGRSVLVSPGHPTADGRLVGDLRAGDALDGARVLSAEREPYDGGFTFDVRPAGATGVYWANGVLLGSTIP